MAQRKSIIATEEAAPGSPLRRSSRIATGSPAPGAVATPASAVARRRSSANVETTTTPAKIVRSKRLSLSQEVSEEKSAATPKRSSRTKSPTPQPEKPAGTPARRGRKSSAAKSEDEPQAAPAAIPVATVTGRRRSLRGQSTSPEKVEPVKSRGRRVSITEKVTPMEAIEETDPATKTETKKPVKRTRQGSVSSRRGSVDTIEEKENEEVATITNKNLSVAGAESKRTPRKIIRASSKSPIAEEEDEASAKKKLKSQELNPIVETSFAEEDGEEKAAEDHKETSVKSSTSSESPAKSPKEAKSPVKQKEQSTKQTVLPLKKIASQVQETETKLPSKETKSQEAEAAEVSKSEESPDKENKSVVKESAAETTTKTPMKETATKTPMKETATKTPMKETATETPKEERKSSNKTPMKEAKTSMNESKTPLKEPSLTPTQPKSPTKDSPAAISKSPLLQTKTSQKSATPSKEPTSPTEESNDVDSSQSSIEPSDEVFETSKTPVRHSPRLSKTPQKDIPNETGPSQAIKDQIVAKTEVNNSPRSSKDVGTSKTPLRHSPRLSKTLQSDELTEADTPPKSTTVEDSPVKNSPRRSSPRLSSPTKKSAKVIEEATSTEVVDGDSPLKVVDVGDEEIAIGAEGLKEDEVNSTTPDASPVKSNLDESGNRRRSNRLSKSFSEDTQNKPLENNFKPPKPLTPKTKPTDNLLVNELEMTLGSDGSFHLNLSTPNSTTSHISADEKNKTIADVLNTSGGSDGSDKENRCITSQDAPNQTLDELKLTEIIVNTLNKATVSKFKANESLTSTPKNETNKSFFEPMEVEYASDIEDSVIVEANKSTGKGKSSRKSLNVTYEGEGDVVNETNAEDLMNSFVDELNDSDSDELDLQVEDNGSEKKKSDIEEDVNATEKRRSISRGDSNVSDDNKKDKRRSKVLADVHNTSDVEDKKNKRRSKVQDDVQNVSDDDDDTKNKRRSDVRGDVQNISDSENRKNKRRSKAQDDVQYVAGDGDNKNMRRSRVRGDIENISDDEDDKIINISHKEHNNKRRSKASNDVQNISDDEDNKTKRRSRQHKETSTSQVQISDDDNDVADSKSSSKSNPEDDKIDIPSESSSDIEVVNISDADSDSNADQNISLSKQSKAITRIKGKSDSVEVIVSNDEDDIEELSIVRKRTSLKSTGGDTIENISSVERKSRRSKVHDDDSVEEDNNKRTSKTPDKEKSRNKRRSKANDDSDNETQEENISQSALDKFISKKLIEYVSSEDDDEEYVPRNEFVDDEAFEGEEDTPSEGSNDIIDEGESLHSSDTEDEDEDDYENDSFVVDDESDVELLSGDEYDLGDEKKPKSKKKKKSRIVPVSDSEDEVEEPIVLDDDAAGDELDVPIGSKINIIQDITLKPSSENMLINDEDNLKSLEVIKLDNPSNIPEEIVIKDKKRQSLIVAETPNNSFTGISSPSTKKSKRKTSISIQESIKVSEMGDNDITDKITKAVDFFCASIKEKHGNVSLNVSLDYANHSNSSEEDTGKKKLKRISGETSIHKVRPSLTVANVETEVLNVSKDDFVEDVVEEMSPSTKNEVKRSKRQKRGHAVDDGLVENVAPTMAKRISNNFYEEVADSPKKTSKRVSSVMQFEVDKKTPQKQDVKDKRKSAKFEVAESSPLRVSKDTPIKPERQNKRQSMQFVVADDDGKNDKKSIRLEETSLANESSSKLDVSLKKRRKSGLQNASLIVESASPKQLDVSVKKSRKSSLQNESFTIEDDEDKPKQLDVSVKKSRKSDVQNDSFVIEDDEDRPKQLDSSTKKKRKSKQLDVNVSTGDVIGSLQQLNASLKMKRAEKSVSIPNDDDMVSPKKMDVSVGKSRKSLRADSPVFNSTMLDTSVQKKRRSASDNTSLIITNDSPKKGGSLSDSSKKLDVSIKKKKKIPQLEIVGTAITIDDDDDEVVQTTPVVDKKKKTKKRARVDTPGEVVVKRAKLIESELPAKTKKQKKSKLVPSSTIGYLPPDLLMEVSKTPNASSRQVPQAVKPKVKKIKVAASTRTSSDNLWDVEEVVAIKPSKRNQILKPSVKKQVEEIKSKFADNDFRNRMIYDSQRNKRTENKKAIKNDEDIKSKFADRRTKDKIIKKKTAKAVKN